MRIDFVLHSLQFLHKNSIALIKMALLVCLCAFTNQARALTLTPYFEAVLVSGVSTSWTTVSLENTYANAIPVCSHVLGTFAGTAGNYVDPPAATRIRNITANSFQVRVQGWEDGPTSTTDVHCIVVDEGAHTFPDGRLVEAHSVLSDQTSGQNATDGAWDPSLVEDVTSSLVHSYTDPVVLGQVISYNDNRASTIYVNDCTSRLRQPFFNGPTDSVCVGKQIGMIADSRNPETIGYIVADAGSGTVNNVFYELALGADRITGNNAANTGRSYSLNADHNIAVVTQARMDGVNGSWAVLYGADPLPPNLIVLAVDEEEVAGDRTRNHTTEPLYYWAFSGAEITLEKELINDHGGTATLLDFPLTAAGPVTVSGVSGTPDVTNAPVSPGIYVLSEPSVFGYTAGSWSCTGATNFAGSSVEISVGDDVTCTIVNDDDLVATLTLVKQITNNSGGSAVATDFTLKYSGPSGSNSGVTGDASITSVPVFPGVYDLGESDVPGYTLQGIKCDGIDSDGSDGVKISAGENVTCFFLNDDLGIDLRINKTVDNTAPNVGDALTFTLTVNNIGPDTATDVQVFDPIPAGFSYIAASMAGGDVRDDSDPTGTGLIWTINSLASGASTSLTFQATVLAP